MKKTLIVAMLASLILQGAPIGALAQTTSTNALQSQIQAFLAQIKSLNDQLANLQKQKQDIAIQLVASLREGSQGDQVQVLQALLAADTELYPEGLITGFFGKATARAVARFQKKYGLEQVGFVGPRTLKKLNELFQKDQLSFEDDDDSNHGDNKIAEKLQKAMNKDAKEALKNLRKVCAKVPPGHEIAPGWLRKHDGVRPLVPLCQHLPPGIINNAHATSTPTSTPDTTAPFISSVVVTPSSTSANVSWTTNESSTSKVYASTVSPVDLNATGTLSVLDSALVTAHSLNLSGLTASTTYNFIVESADAATNKATSSGLFVTMP